MAAKNNRCGTKLPTPEEEAAFEEQFRSTRVAAHPQSRSRSGPRDQPRFGIRQRRCPGKMIRDQISALTTRSRGARRSGHRLRLRSRRRHSDDERATVLHGLQQSDENEPGGGAAAWRCRNAQHLHNRRRLFLGGRRFRRITPRSHERRGSSISVRCPAARPCVSTRSPPLTRLVTGSVSTTRFRTAARPTRLRQRPPAERYRPAGVRVASTHARTIPASIDFQHMDTPMTRATQSSPRDRRGGAAAWLTFRE